MTQLTNPTQPDSNERTWHILERDDGSVVVYYTRRGYQAHYMVYDTLDSVTDQQAEIDRLYIENERLRAALEPFAKAAEMWDRTKGSCSATDVVPLTMAPYRAARAALAGGEVIQWDDPAKIADFFTGPPTTGDPYEAFGEWATEHGYDVNDDAQFNAALEAYGGEK